MSNDKAKDTAAETVETGGASRRKFLTGAAAATAGATAAVAAPQISRAQTTTIKMQGAWGSGDIFNEYAEDYAKMVNEMGGGRLKIDYLTSGSVVKAFRVQDAVDKGVLDAGHLVAAYWYGKNKAASLFGTAPVYGWDAHMGLGWIWYGGGQELYNELVQDILGLNVVGFFCMPMPAQPLGWFNKEVNTASDMDGLKYRTVGLATDVMQAMGVRVTQLPGGEIVPALERGVIEAFEYNNPTSDRAFGAHDVAEHYYLGSYHQAMEFFEVIFNKDLFDSLPDEHKAILNHAAKAASSDNYWKGLDRYSKDLQWLQDEGGVKVHRTDTSILEAQLQAWDSVLEELNKDAFFKKVTDSQRAYAERVGYYLHSDQPDYVLAWEHYFGKLPS
ncbi:TRAP transporter substrate-binding protein [Ferruginivarius sediminum]|uniref:C4-dicarboxylate ABC transporter n=1 Tax=Ferruginivarius sediminum TaxID=2661937 RepID=A0A369TCD8_9PROT|nr:TRAP transporter substrate-binding protein [Ferruginivarius sediminum]RDD60576.1 C4-dicarboxylate ABC transporter [Ferruginivarius sediminum]